MKKGTSWVYELKKQDLILKLKDLGLVFDEADTVDRLRQILLQELRSENKEENRISEKVTQVKTKNKAATYGMETYKIEFRLHEDDWDIFIERLELYFITHDIEKSKYVPELLIKVSAETYILIRNLAIQKTQITFHLKKLLFNV